MLPLMTGPNPFLSFAQAWTSMMQVPWLLEMQRRQIEAMTAFWRETMRAWPGATVAMPGQWPQTSSAAGPRQTKPTLTLVPSAPQGGVAPPSAAAPEPKTPAMVAPVAKNTPAEGPAPARRLAAMPATLNPGPKAPAGTVAKRKTSSDSDGAASGGRAKPGKTPSRGGKPTPR
jgi:hypothetical protein